MKEFNSSLVREKFVITDASRDMSEAVPVIALSNRMTVPLINKKGEIEETYVVRAQNMHSCVRYAARIVRAYENQGSLSKSINRFDWEGVWRSVVNDYERDFNPYRWIVVYRDGHPIYSDGQYNPFLDVVEKCDHANTKDYEYTIPIALDAFKKKGKAVKIDHDSNVALSLHFEGNRGRCGIILRGAHKTTTFSFSTSPKKGKDTISIPRCMSASAAFLEGVQLAFMVGMNMEKIRRGIIERFSVEEKQTKEAQRRLGLLTREINGIEEEYKVNYRSEKPNFGEILNEAEDLAIELFTPDDEVVK